MMKRLFGKKAQEVSQAFVIIVSAFVLIMILLWGGRAIYSFTERTNQAKLVDFTIAIKSNIENVAFQRGAVEHVELTPPSGITKVCFAEKGTTKLTPTTTIQGVPSLVIDRVQRVEENVFLIPSSEIAVFVKNMLVKGGAFCIDAAGGSVEVRAVGSGKKVCVSDWKTSWNSEVNKADPCT